MEIIAHDLMDPDGSGRSTRATAAIETAIWQWYRSSSPSAMGTEIDGETNAAYTPQDSAGNNDVGMYLRVVATYNDGKGDGETASAVSEYATIDDISVNTAPQFSAAER